jgi:hypothetical protein
MTSETANYDEPWKEALGEYFEAFLHSLAKINIKKTGFFEKPVFL